MITVACWKKCLGHQYFPTGPLSSESPVIPLRLSCNISFCSFFAGENESVVWSASGCEADPELRSASARAAGGSLPPPPPSGTHQIQAPVRDRPQCDHHLVRYCVLDHPGQYDLGCSCHVVEVGPT